MIRRTELGEGEGTGDTYLDDNECRTTDPERKVYANVLADLGIRPV